MSASVGAELRGRARPSLSVAVRDVGRPVARARLRPLALLIVLLLISLGARSAWLGRPCDRPCTSVGQHRLIFDESYYVNAARVIAGVPLGRGAQYGGSPSGVDPNSEHPQLAKVIIAGAITVLGDGPLAWRAGSLIMGSLAILGIYALVLGAGGRRPLALGAAALMAADNLLLVHGRLATLDVYVLAPMLWAAVLYLRGRRLSAGVLLGVALSMKLVAVYLLVVLALAGMLRLLNESGGLSRRDVRRAVAAGGRRLMACAAAAAASYLVLLDLLDRLAPPYDPVGHRVITGGPISHTLHMLRFAAQQTSPHGPTGISSYPWVWFADLKPIVYSDIGLVNPANRHLVLAPTGHFLAFISPPVLAFAVPALALALWGVRRRTAGPAAMLGAAWLLGTFVPFALLSLFAHRTSYLYYMVVVMPGVYLLVTDMFARPGVPRWALVSWIAAVALAAVALYPFTPLPYLG